MFKAQIGYQTENAQYQQVSNSKKPGTPSCDHLENYTGLRFGSIVELMLVYGRKSIKKKKSVRNSVEDLAYPLTSFPLVNHRSGMQRVGLTLSHSMP